VYEFTLTGIDAVDLGSIVYDQMGLYTYTLTCTSAPAPYYTLDREVYSIEVYMGHSLNSVVMAYNAAGNKMESIQYDHLYEFGGSLLPVSSQDPPVKKTLSGDNPAQKSTFTFELKADSPKNPMPAGSVQGIKTITIEGAGEKEFGTWNYTEQGTYRYTVSEVDSGASGYTYDKTIYTMTDTVTALSDGQLVVDRVITNDARTQVQTLAFVNAYQAPAIPGIIERIGNAIGLPQTGDVTTTMRWLVTILVGIACLLIVIARRRKDKEAETDRI